MAMSPFLIVFKLSRKALREIAKTVANPAPRFELP